MVSKNRPLSKLLFALGICHIGVKASEIIAKRFKSMDILFGITVEEFIKIPEIGNTMALSLKEFFENKTVRCIIHALNIAGVNMIEPEVKSVGQFEGKVFVLTGELKCYTREQVDEIIKSLGGKTNSSVSKKTDYVLAGKNAGLKLDMAKRLSVKIIDEIEFKRLITKK
jgi:DNA ligase (NAD+)